MRRRSAQPTARSRATPSSSLIAPIAGHKPWASALTQLVENAQRDTGKYEKFSIVSLDAQQSVHPLFSICNPGEPTFWSDLYRGRRYTTRDFEQRFVGAAETVIAEIREPSEAPHEPDR
jgi:hypothetical protein